MEEMCMFNIDHEKWVWQYHPLPYSNQFLLKQIESILDDVDHIHNRVTDLYDTIVSADEEAKFDENTKGDW